MREFQEFTKWLQDMLEGTVHLYPTVQLLTPNNDSVYKLND